MDRQRFLLVSFFGRVRSLMCVQQRTLARSKSGCNEQSLARVSHQSSVLTGVMNGLSWLLLRSGLSLLHQFSPSVACFISVHQSLAQEPCKFRGFGLALEIFIYPLQVLHFNIKPAAFSFPILKKIRSLVLLQVQIWYVWVHLLPAPRYRGGAHGMKYFQQRGAPLPDVRTDMWNILWAGFKHFFSEKSQ